MGGGENYRLKWNEWFKHLSQSEKQAYMAQYPEPEDWFEFYHLEPPQTRKELLEGFECAGRFLQTYIDKQYELAVLHEEARHYGYATIHLGNVLFCLTTYTIWDDAKLSKAVERYKALKQRLAQQMSLNPMIRESWHALCQPNQRSCVVPQQTRVTAEDYTRIQQESYLPSELGRTWVHCFEAETLYIHRHWQEPCLFLVPLEPVKPGFRITKTWMNLDPAISRPLTLPEKEPAVLLTWLLSNFIKDD